MPLYNSLDAFIKYLKSESLDDSFLSNDFISMRDKDYNILRNKKDVLNYFNEFKKDIEFIKAETEESYDLIYFMYDNILYILKAKYDEFGIINQIVIEEYNKDYINTVIVIEYDGKNYFGMQKQSDESMPTIQAEIEKALHIMLNKNVDVVIASRTDRGVHAKGQVAQFYSFGIDPKKYMYALNNILPLDIRIKDAYSRSQLFNARFDCVKKTYNYIIDLSSYSVFKKDYVWYQKIIDLDYINNELKSLIGTHDFKAFCRGENDNTIRTIYEAKAIKVGDEVIFSFTGSGFLHNMIRFIVGSVVDLDKTRSSSLKDLIDKGDKNLTNKIAPASGLYLTKIYYAVK